MYVIVNKVTNRASIIKDKTTLAYIIGKCTNTILRKEGLNVWEVEKYYIYNPDLSHLKSNRGGNRR